MRREGKERDHLDWSNRRDAVYMNKIDSPAKTLSVSRRGLWMSNP